ARTRTSPEAGARPAAPASGRGAGTPTSRLFGTGAGARAGVEVFFQLSPLRKPVQLCGDVEYPADGRGGLRPERTGVLVLENAGALAIHAAQGHVAGPEHGLVRLAVGAELAHPAVLVGGRNGGDTDSAAPLRNVNLLELPVLGRQDGLAIKQIHRGAQLLGARAGIALEGA